MVFEGADAAAVAEDLVVEARQEMVAKGLRQKQNLCRPHTFSAQIICGNVLPGVLVYVICGWKGDGECSG